VDGTRGLGFRPLYRQVREVLEKRIAEGLWAPGRLLPSEPEIAADLGVSQGTVRKALDEMTARNLLVRRQGRGTFVARHDEARILFQFFKLVADDEERAFPESRVLKVRVEPAGAAAEPLAIAPSEPVVAIERVRSLKGLDCIAERIVLPRRLFPGLEDRGLPNNLYQLFAADYGVTIARASERLRAVAAGPGEAERLGVPAGTPLLAIDRIAFQLDDRPAEWRVSLCRTDRFHYRADLR
jgi:GntR family transcriptional regulator